MAEVILAEALRTGQSLRRTDLQECLDLYHKSTNEELSKEDLAEFKRTQHLIKEALELPVSHNNDIIVGGRVRALGAILTRHQKSKAKVTDFKPIVIFQRSLK